MINGHLTPVVDWFGLPYIGPPHWLVVLNSELVAPWAGNYRYFSKEQRRCVNSDNLKLETQPLRVYQYMPADFLVRNSLPHGLNTPPPSFYIGSLLGQKLYLVEFVPGRWSRRACGLIRADIPFPRLEVPYRSSAASQEGGADYTYPRQAGAASKTRRSRIAEIKKPWKIFCRQHYTEHYRGPKACQPC